jgi:hypothetical protein
MSFDEFTYIYFLDKWGAALRESKSFKNGKEEIIVGKLSNRE